MTVKGGDNHLPCPFGGRFSLKGGEEEYITTLVSKLVTEIWGAMIELGPNDSDMKKTCMSSTGMP